jgi:hypothetical protein
MKNKVVVPVLICSPTGYGKSSSFRNLNPERTVIINLENKPLPFKGFNSFKNINVTSFKKFSQLLAQLKTSEDYDNVVIDSFTSLTEIIHKYCEVTFNGFEIYKQYNNMIQDALWSIKDLQQQVFVTAIPEYLEVNFGESKGYAKVKGKEWKYSIEKEFAIVLWIDLIEDDDGIVIEHRFSYKPNKHNTAKSPHELLSGDIPNDCQLVLDKIVEYYE